MKLTNQTILITGGTSGIGFELVKQLSALKNTIIITGRNQTKLAQTKKQFPQIHTFQSDVSDPEAIKRLFEQVTKEFPNLNILINNAGIMKEINVHAQNELQELTKEIEINLNGPIRMTQQFLAHLKSKPEALIMNVSSGLAFVPLPISPVYCATKAGLHSYTQSLRAQMKNTNVQIFELAPPATQTELLASHNQDNMKGITIMKVEEMVAAAIKGIQQNQLEICPGQSKQLRMMSRLAPQFILKQMSKTVDRMLVSTKH